MAGNLRRCRWCGHPLIPAGRPQPALDRVREAHCPNPQCDWCGTCYRQRTEAIKAGHGDLLEPGKPSPFSIPDPDDQT